MDKVVFRLLLHLLYLLVHLNTTGISCLRKDIQGVCFLRVQAEVELLMKYRSSHKVTKCQKSRTQLFYPSPQREKVIEFVVFHTT